MGQLGAPGKINAPGRRGLPFQQRPDARVSRVDLMHDNSSLNPTTETQQKGTIYGSV